MLLLAIYALAGMFTAPFHADESMYISESRDYVTFFVIGQPHSLRVDPPVQIGSPDYLRLLTGTVSTNAMGFVLWHTGYRDLENWQPAWEYTDDWMQNLAAGRLPPDSVLHRARLVSAYFLAGSIGLIAMIATRIASPRAGLLAAMAFGLNPVILLNGRRAMQEGALMFFTLLSVWLALRAVEKRRWFDWALLGMAMALALASKASALVPLIGIVLGLILAMRRIDLKAIAITALSAAIMFLAITPAIWTNPPARLRLAAELRRDVLAGQTDASPDAHRSLIDRATALVTQPFPSKVQYYESPDFAGIDDLQREIDVYDSSPLRGILLPAPVGIALALLGLMHLLQTRRMNPLLLAWAGLTPLLLVMVVPLAWGRYYLPWTLAVTVFAGFGLDFLAGSVQSFWPEKFRLITLTRPSKP